MKILISKIRYDATNLTEITKIFVKYLRYNWIPYGWLIIYITDFSVFVELWGKYATILMDLLAIMHYSHKLRFMCVKYYSRDTISIYINILKVTSKCTYCCIF